MDRYGYSIFCDDIRNEAGGKLEFLIRDYGLPIWDLLFDTWSNPEKRSPRVGFDDDKSDRIHDMLMLRDVHS